MNSNKLVTVQTAAVVIIAATYLVAALVQRNALNLSATAGGQYPYIMNAERMANDGVLNYMGDRNRTPLYPALLSVLYANDEHAFLNRCTLFACASSLSLVCFIGLVAFRLLSPWGALTTTIVAAFQLFLDRASFVQAELLYYTIFLATWLCMCRVLIQPSWRFAALAGMLGGIAYLAKASALPLIAVFLLANVSLAVYRYIQAKRLGQALEQLKPMCARAYTISALVTAVCWSMVISPYALDNYRRFGHPLYNVNSTFFMWCDSWQEAKAFADRYSISEEYPDAPPQQTPSLKRYLSTHTVEQVVRRELAGLTTLIAQAARDPASRSVTVVLLVAIALAVIRRERSARFLRTQKVLVGFTIIVFVGYVLIYGWYAQIAFGLRFVQSLYLPALFGGMFVIDRMLGSPGDRRATQAQVERSSHHAGRPDVRWFLAAYVLMESVGPIVRVARPSNTFIHFYFNESRAALVSGNDRAAESGFRGVLDLDANHAAAQRSLGYLLLRQGRLNESIEILSLAIESDPGHADAYNSLGSAYARAGEFRTAADAFSQAVALDSGNPMAWYNLAGTRLQLGQRGEARDILARLRRMQSPLADQLDALLRKR